MSALCGIDCTNCSYKLQCKGCEETCGKPLGGECIAAEYIKKNGKESYEKFKTSILERVNKILNCLDFPVQPQLFELAGSYVNLAYPIPNGKTVKFLDDTQIYLGCQIQNPSASCYIGVVAGNDFTIVTSYEANGTNPKLLLYKKESGVL